MQNGTEFLTLFQRCQAAKRILIVGDGKPDGDSLGSSSGMLNWLLREGKEVAAFCAAPIPSAFSYLDGIHLYSSDPNLFRQPWDVIMTFDSGDPRRCGIEQLLPLLPPGYLLVDIDHHTTNTRFGHLNLVYPEACSTAEVVFRFLESNHVMLDAKIATSLLTGIFTDTMTFSNAATTSQGIEAASKLCAAGARQNEILRKLFKNKSIEGLKLWGLAFSRLQHHAKYDLAFTYFLKKDLEGASEDAVEGVINFLNATCGAVDTFMVLKEQSDGKVKGSFRSAKRDISKMARFFGGGGHKKAAGFTVEGSLETENGHIFLTTK